MPIDAVPRTGQTQTGGAGQPSAGGTQGPAPGTEVEARVTAVLEDGTIRLATPFGTAQVGTEVPLQVGQRLRLIVQNAAAGLTLGLLTEGQEAAAPLPQAASDLQPSQAPALLRAMAEVMQRGTTSSAGTAALFANLPAILRGDAGRLPAEAVAPVSTVLAHALSSEQPVTAQAVKDVIHGSGLFREARLAAGDGAALAGGADLKSALLSLRAVLGGIIEALDRPALPDAEGAEASAAPRDPAPSTAGVGSPETQAEPDGAAPGNPRATLPAPGAASAEDGRSPAGDPATAHAAPPAPPVDEGAPEARPAPDRKAAEGAGQPASAQTQAAAKAGPGDALPAAAALVRLLGRSLPGEVPAQAEAAEPASGATIRSDPGAGDPAGAPLQARVPADPYRNPAVGYAPRQPRPAGVPPRADLPPRAEPSSLATVPAGAGTVETARLLLGEAESALDRTLLNQFASLPRDEHAPGHVQHPQAWMLDVPVLIGREAAMAQLRVARDGGSRAGGVSGEGPHWSVDLALDSRALGPVHARVRLAGGGVSVTMWAERPDTAEQLRAASPDLRKALDEAALLVDDVAFHTGAPQQPAASKGYFVDQRS